MHLIVQICTVKKCLTTKYPYENNNETNEICLIAFGGDAVLWFK